MGSLVVRAWMERWASLANQGFLEYQDHQGRRERKGVSLSALLHHLHLHLGQDPRVKRASLASLEGMGQLALLEHRDPMGSMALMDFLENQGRQDHQEPKETQVSLVLW